MLFGRYIKHAGRVAVVLEARTAACFGLKTIDRKGLIVASAWMRGMVEATA